MLTKISSDDVYFWNTIRTELPNGGGFSKIKGGLTLEDWKYVKVNLAGNTPYHLKCVTRIKELNGD